MHPVILAGLLSATLFPPASGQNSVPNPSVALVWVADHKILKGINTASNQVAQVVPLSHEAEALAVDPGDGALWVLSHKQVLKFDPSGNLLLDLDLKSLAKQIEEPKPLTLSPYDGSVWIAGEKGLLHLDSQGGQLLEWESPDPIRALVLDMDETLWVLTGKQLLRLSPQAAVLQSLDLQGVVHEPRLLAVDALGGALWLTGEKALLRFNRNDPAQPPQEIALPGAEKGHGKEMGKMGGGDTGIAALSLHPLLGTLYVAAKENLVIYDRAGSLIKTIALAPFGLEKAESLAFEPASLSLWLGGKAAVGRFTPEGDLVAKVPVEKEAEVLGVSPPHLLPVLALIEPPDGSVTNNPKPPIRLGLGATLNGVSRELGDAYFAGLVFDAELNGQPIGSLFSVSGREAAYTPAQPLSEGESAFSVQATDLFGRKSNRITSRFTVDTIPPKFGSITPADGSLVAMPSVTITGAVDDPQASVILKDQTGATLGTGGASFSFPVTLKLGINAFALHAVDSAGNTAQAPLRITLDNVPPATPNALLISVGAPVSGVVTVTGAAGSVEAGASVTITNSRTGQAVTVVARADGSFAAQISAQPGDDLLLTARDAAGNVSGAVKKQVQPVQSGATAYVLGTVFDTSSGVPLSGVRVRARGLNDSVQTDGDGRFRLPVPGRGVWVLFFERDGYIEARREGATRPGGDATVGRVGMRAWDTRAVLIPAATGGTMTDSTGNVQAIFPPGALAQDLSVSATFLPTRDSFPLPLPGNMAYLGGVQMGPEHVTFQKPVTMRIRNLYNLPPGTAVPFFFASHDENDANEGFYDPGTGVVTSDGAFIEYQVTHFSCMALGKGPPEEDGQGTDDGDDTEENDDPNDDDCQGGSSTVSHCRGRLRLVHELPSFSAFGRNDSLSLVYDSITADPRPLVSSRVNMGGFFGGVAPAGVRARLTIEGVQTETYLAPSSQAMAHHFQWSGRKASGEKLSTGSYPYVLEAANLFTEAAPGGGGGAAVEPYGPSVRIAGRVMIHDRSPSPLGAGWGVSEVDRIHRNTDGTLLFARGDGGATVFHPRLANGTPPVSTLATGFSDPRSVAPAPGGGVYVSSYNAGTIHHAASDGSKTLVASGLSWAKGIGVAPDGTLYAAASGNSVYKVAPGGSPQLLANLGSVDHLDDLAIGPDGNIYVLDGGFGVIHKVTPAGEKSFFYNGLAQGFGNSLLNNSMSMAFDKLGNLYVTNNYNYYSQVRCGFSYISKFDQLGNHTYFRVGLNVPRGIAVDDAGNLFVADYDCNGTGYQIKMFTPAGEELAVAEDIAGDVMAFGLAYDLAFASGTLYMVRPSGDVLTMSPNTSGDSRLTALFKPRLANFSEIRQDADGNLTQVDRDGTTKVFSPEGLHIETRKPQGLFWRYEHDSENRLTARANAAGHRWEFRYGGGSLTEIVDPAGRSVRLTVDGSNNLVKVEEPEGAMMSYSYDDSHRIVSKTDSRGFTGTYVYGPLGNLTEARQANGEARSFSAGRMQNAVTAERAAGSSLESPVSLPPPGQVEDAYTDGRGITRSLVTNRYGSAERRTDALGNATQIKRNLHNRATEIAHPNGAKETFKYDENNLLIEKRHSQGFRATYSYDAMFRVTGIESDTSPSQRLVYDDRYNLVRIQSGGGAEAVTVNFTYNAFGQPVTSELAGKITRFEYDSNGRLIRVKNPLGQATEYEHDSAGNRALVRDALGRETRFEYDGLGRAVKIVDPSGAETRFTWESACATCGTRRHLLTAVTDANGRATRFEYNELGKVVREIDPAGNVTEYGYDGDRSLSTIRYPNGITVELSRDAEGRLVRKTTPDDAAEFSYDAMGNMVSARDGDSEILHEFDLANRLIRIVTGGASQSAADLVQNFWGYTRSHLYASAGGAGLARYSWYDSLLRLYSVEETGGARYGFRYDPSGRRSSLVYPGGKSLDYGYDDASRLLSLSGTVLPGRIDYGYDPVGRRVSEIRSTSATPRLTLSVDQTTVTEETLAVTGKVTGGAATVAVNGNPMAVDGGGNVSGTVSLAVGYTPLAVSVTDSKGAVSTKEVWVYRGSPSTGANIGKVSAVAPNGDVYVIENEVIMGSAPWAVALLAWIPGGAVIPSGSGTLTRPAWLIPAVDIAVDSSGRVYTVRWDGTLWVHDTSGDQQVADLSSLGITDMEVGPDDKVYVAAGNTIYRIEAGSPVVYATLPPEATSVSLDSSSWGLVALDHTNGVFYRVESGNATPFFSPGFYILDFAVDPAGTVCYEGEGWECRRQDDSVDFPSLQGPSLAFGPGGLMYVSTMDNVWRIEGALQTPLITGAPVSGTLTVEANVFADETSANYTYNPRGELVQVMRHPVGEEHYAYDPAGNRTSDHKASDYVFNEVNQLTAGNGAVYTHDANGNRLSELRTLTSELTTYTWSAENRLKRIDFPDGGYAEYAYDPFGRRIQKKLVAAGGAETIRRYVYDREDILFELDGNGAVVTEYIHGPGIDEPIAIWRDGKKYYYHQDALGSIVAITDDTGTLVQRYEYDAYGAITYALDPTFKQPYGFTGREYDEESGLYYYRARYYDPKVGRFLSKDPIGFAGGDVNLYRYVVGDPVNGRDPWGLLSRIEQVFVPQNVVDNTKATINQLSNNAFSEKELQQVTQKILDTIQLDEALRFKDVIPGKDVIELTKEQAKIMDDILQRLKEQYPNDPLVDKLREEYEKAKKTGKCRIR